MDRDSTHGSAVARTQTFHERMRCVWKARDHQIAFGRSTWIMGILNCTPDSFSDGGRYLDPREAGKRLEQMLQEGADCVDVGGESTRPGAEPVSAEEEWARVRPALEAAKSLGCPAPVSIDTTKYEVAARALDLGVSILNDVSGLRAEPRLADLAAGSGAGLILMHRKGTPRTMQSDPRYEDVAAEVVSHLQESLQMAADRGVATEQMMVDPGIGFGKTLGPQSGSDPAPPRVGAIGTADPGRSVEKVVPWADPGPFGLCPRRGGGPVGRLSWRARRRGHGGRSHGAGARCG